MLNKNIYETPEVEAIALTLEGTIAGSTETDFSITDPFGSGFIEEEW